MGQLAGAVMLSADTPVEAAATRLWEARRMLRESAGAPDSRHVLATATLRHLLTHKNVRIRSLARQGLDAYPQETVIYDG